VKTIVLSAFFVLALSGCARFSVTQTDESPEARKITTKLTGTTWFTSAQHLTKIKALQTDKTQSFGSDTFGQQGDTNIVAVIQSLTTLLQTLRPAP
jgi:hypothetical protein